MKSRRKGKFSKSDFFVYENLETIRSALETIR